jgi:hypothetical protein
MPLTNEDWEQIYEAIEAKQRPFEVYSGIVTRSEVGRMLVWCEKEFGDQPILWCGQYYRVFYMDDSPKETTGYSLTNPPGNPYKERKREAIFGNSAHVGGYGGEDAGYKYIIPEIPPPGTPILVAKSGGYSRFLWGFAVILGYTTI